jgi:5-methylcytosine-specific restriction endonuclease McrA
MTRKLPYTPKSRVRSALRQLFLRSRERAKRLKEDGYTCQRCGVKQSRAKGREVYVEVHHKHGVCNWSEIFSVIYKHLLCHPDGMQTLCRECHSKEKETK